MSPSIPNPATTNWVPVGPGATPAAPISVTYVGDYNNTKVYNDGDIVVGADGITYQCVKQGTVGVTPTPWQTAILGVPQPVVNGQWVKGVGGAAVWQSIIETDVRGLVIADTIWHVVGTAGEPGYQSGYSSWDGMSQGARMPRFRKLSSGLVIVEGILSTPNPASNGPAFTLPAGYRPASVYGDISLILNATGYPVLGNVNINGLVALSPMAGVSVPVASWVYLSGMHFYAEA